MNASEPWLLIAGKFWFLLIESRQSKWVVQICSAEFFKLADTWLFYIRVLWWSFLLFHWPRWPIFSLFVSGLLSIIERNIPIHSGHSRGLPSNSHICSLVKLRRWKNEKSMTNNWWFRGELSWYSNLSFRTCKKLAANTWPRCKSTHPFCGFVEIAVRNFYFPFINSSADFWKQWCSLCWSLILQNCFS